MKLRSTGDVLLGSNRRFNRTRMGKLSILVALVGLATGPCFGTEPGAPPITEKTLVGTWEGTAGLWYWYRMEILSHGGYLAYVSSPAPQDQAVYRLISSNIKPDKVELRFQKVTKGSSSPEEISIEGEGWAYGDGGLFYATVMHRPGSVGGESKIEFVKGTPTRLLARMFKQAERLILEQKQQK
jgi:hypothetical protein